MALDTIWDRPPHTAVKHEILRKYLGAWFPKLTRYHGRVLFVDGFAGPGKYSKGEPGSPIVALDCAINHRHDLSHCELLFLFIEEDDARFSHLQASLSELTIPDHMKVEAIQGTFTDVLGETVNQLEGNRLAPALVMIDPFGVKGVSHSMITRLASYPRTEFVISFMYEPITRFLGSNEFEPHLDQLFGSPDWRQALPLAGAARRTFLLGLYLSQVRSAGMEYARTFEMRDEKNKTEYFLIFATHHPAGLKAMKEAMWKVDPSGSFMFSDFTNPGQPTLFALEPNYSQLRTSIVERFAGTETTIDIVEAFVIEETPFLDSHIRKNILIPMEQSGLILVDETTRKRRRSYPSGTKLRFL